MTHLSWRLSVVASFGVSLLLCAVNAHGQDTALEAVVPQNEAAADNVQGADSETYDSAYFNRYAPATARDMVDQVPGFQLEGSDGKRGLGQGGANVLINGERITGKTGVGSQLSRISAANVIRIEIKDGASLDIPGLSGQVANIVTKTSGNSGTFSWEPEFRKGLKPSLDHIHLTVSGETGNLSYSAEIKNEAARQGNRGPEFLTQADGLVFERRDEDFQNYRDAPGVSADLTWKPKEDHIGNLNLEYNIFNYNEREVSRRTALAERPAGSTPPARTAETLFTFAEDEWNASAGADYEFPLGPGKLKAIGYYRFEHSPTESQFDIFEFASRVGGDRFNRVADEAETIARTEYSWSTADGRDWTAALEGAFNYLDIEADLSIFDNDQFVAVPLPGASSRVEEKRAETTLTHNRKLSEKWNLQTSAGVEYSELSQTGGLLADEFVRDFVRPKGFVSAVYNANETLTISTKIEREVGQLNFFDFISSVNISDNLDTAGNINLVPSQSWLGEVELDKNFGGGTTFKVRIYAELISDLVDRIPIDFDDGTFGDAVGNIDKARRYGIDLDATVKGDKWGLPGTELTGQVNFRNSEVDDPLTEIERRLNSDNVSYWFAEFRHDIPKTDWAYGFAVDRFKQSATFRLNTISDGDGANPFGRVYVEHKDILGLKIRAELQNLFGARDDFERQFFTARRDQGELDFTETNERTYGVIGKVRFSGTF